MKKIMFGSISEWDIGLDGIVYDTVEALKDAQRVALVICGIEDSFEELEGEGLVGFEEIEVLSVSDDFTKLREANRARQAVWPGGSAADAPFRTIEFGEEAGELLGAVKKLMRAQRGIAGNVGKSIEDLKMNVLEEIGDVLISLDLMTDAIGVDIRDCIPMKFNKTSRKVGLPVFMDADWELTSSDGQAPSGPQLDLFPR
ncbi:nucleotide pyrophosphohydrolase [Ruegeria phage vB_RpoS-V10]|nr:nucleotide pyrophosphohydrolase [Roseobacter phage DSS3P8]AWY09197.1 nucleotide pyrophosphohydrolase [Ruegeria phage vB_RpoS-V10]